MCLENNFSDKIASRMKEELSYYKDNCHYNEKIHKIVYHSLQEAMLAYNDIQMHLMQQERLDEIRLEQHNLGEEYDLEWVTRFSITFRKYWKQTHCFIFTYSE